MSNDPVNPGNSRPPPPRYIPPPPPPSQATTTTSSSTASSNTQKPLKGQRWMIKSYDLNYMGPIEINDVFPVVELASAYIHLTNPRSLFKTQKRKVSNYPEYFWYQNIIEIRILKEEIIKNLKERGMYTPEAEKMIQSLPDIIHMPESAWSAELGEYYLLSGAQQGGKKTRRKKYTNKTHKRR